MVPNNRHQTVKHFLLGSFYIVWQNRRPLSGKGAKGDEETASAGRGGGDLMETTQATQKRVRYQFEIFCMKVIDGERCDYLRKLMKKMGWESSFSDLPEAVLTSLCTFDSDPAEQYIFHVYGHRIPIRNDRLAGLPPGHLWSQRKWFHRAGVFLLGYCFFFSSYSTIRFFNSSNRIFRSFCILDLESPRSEAISRSLS